MAEPISAAVAAKLARLGTAIADGLFGSEDDKSRGVKILIFTLFCIIFFFIYIIVTIPVLLFSLPFATFDELSSYYDTVEAINERWEEEDIEIPWLEVVALAGVVHEQEFDNIRSSHIRSIANDFIKEVERESCSTDDEGNTTCTTWIEYRLRSMREVADHLGLTPDELDIARNYLMALEEGGVRPPANWISNPHPGWEWPVPGYNKASDIYSAFGFRIHPITKKPNDHKGVDIVASTGTQVLAAIEGTVVSIGEDEIYGKFIVIESKNYWTKYAHLHFIRISKRQKVKAGQRLGSVGSTGQSTGPHLHFEVKEKGFFRSKHVNPLKFY
ncbi:MAG: hypothetical protein APF76_04675 [Desulfitibacter sp. BRH_c19]|nr:MAG: hypothetical protein APF76_04675 [Desulfitibacter sp. BRH_c19]